MPASRSWSSLRAALSCSKTFMPKSPKQLVVGLIVEMGLWPASTEGQEKTWPLVGKLRIPALHHGGGGSSVIAHGAALADGVLDIPAILSILFSMRCSRSRNAVQLGN